MRLWILIALACTVVMPTGGLAAPPVPPAPPPELQQPFDGYDLSIVYGLWAWRVEGQKGEAAKIALRSPDVRPGERWIGAPLLEVSRYGDLGMFMALDIRTYCADDKTVELSGCHQIMRWAYVRDEAGARSPENPVSRWTRQNFNAAHVVQRLRELGVAPTVNAWLLDAKAVFANMPSAVPMLAEHVEVGRIDSRDCPGFAKALEKLDQQALDWRLDMWNVGQDTPMQPPNPHSTRDRYKLQITLPGRAGAVTLEGGGEAFDKLINPVLNAADACERAGRR